MFEILVFIVLCIVLVSIYKERHNYKYSNAELAQQDRLNHAADINVGLLKVHEARYSRWWGYILWFVLLASLLLALHYFIGVVENTEALKENCTQFFGINAYFLLQIIGNGCVPFLFFIYLTDSLPDYFYAKKHPEPHFKKQKQPLFFNELQRQTKSEELPQLKVQMLSQLGIFLICLFVFLFILLPIPLVDIFDANTIYQQRCEEKIYPFD